MKKDVKYWFREFKETYPGAKNVDQACLSGVFAMAYERWKGKGEGIIDVAERYIKFLGVNPEKKVMDPFSFLGGKNPDA